MRKIKFILPMVFYFLFLCTLNSYAKTYHYSNYLVNIYINEDGTVKVREEMTFDFRGYFHYAYRTIPIHKFDYLSDIKVYDGELELRYPERKIKDKLGEIDIRWNFDLEDTRHTWTVEYIVHGGLGFFDNWDEIYWNAIPHDRTVPIDSLRVYVYLPQEVDQAKLRYKVYAERTSFHEGTVIDGRTFYFEGKNIAPHSNFTIVAAWPKGLINYAKAKQSFWFRPGILKGGVVTLLTFIFMFSLWYKKGRDIKLKTSIIPKFKPPVDLTPVLAGILIDDRVDTRDITALIIDLAIRGYIKISEEKFGFSIFKKTIYKFKRTPKREGLKPVEELLLKLMFMHGVGDIVSTDDLKDKFYKDIRGIKEKLYEEVGTHGRYYTENPEKTRRKFIWGFFACFILFWTLFAFSLFIPLWLLVSLGLSFLIMGGFGMIMPRRTIFGARVRDDLLGFKMYLQTAERFRLAECTPDTFEKYLSYAVAMGVEEKWARRFKGLTDYNPSWYSSYSGGSFSSTSFSHSFSGLMSGINASSSPQSSGVGFGGGAGGGGGGGGGGAG